MKADLHTHTTLSDGAATPQELLRQAKVQGVTHLAITDHDHLAYSAALAAQAAALGITLFPGVELSTWDAERERKVHLLCYFPKQTADLEAHCQALSAQRTAVGEEMISLVQKQYPITREDVYAYTKGCTSLYRQHIMRALMDYGYTERLYGDLYHALFSPRGGSAFRQVTYPKLSLVLELIHASGGVCVLAHPYEYNTIDLMQELVQQQAIDGIEVWHSRCSPKGEAHLLEYAREHHLLMTAGSDFHGMHSGKPSPLGNRFLDEQQLQAFLDGCNHR